MEAKREKTVIIVPPNPEAVRAAQAKRQLRVAAYCRVSTDDEEQLTSYEAQKTYYTDKIMTNHEWTMAGIFADEGITGTSARKRPEFLRMIRQCKQGKVDLILVKSISRFARNTVDCLNYIRLLKERNIAVFFEKENINTMESDSELLITMMGAFAQAESESISANVRWGKRQAMKEGRVSSQCSRLYGYQKGSDDEPEIIPRQAEVVRRIYDTYLAGASLREICKMLEDEGIPSRSGQAQWSISTVKNILTNEKYCGDVLTQKTYIKSCMDKRVIRNHGELPQYLIRNNHEGIIDRDTYDRVQAEMARRNGTRASSQKNTPTGISRYSSKFALTERLVCGECGTLYRRCTWVSKGEKRIVWRCISRLDYGKKYCHHSPTMEEGPLQKAIITAINRVMSGRDELLDRITNAMQSEISPISSGGMTLSDIDRRLKELEAETARLIQESAGDIRGYQEQFRAVMNEAADLKERKKKLLAEKEQNTESCLRIQSAINKLESAPSQLTEWDESMIRQLVETVTVLNKATIRVTLIGGEEIEQTVENN